MSIDAMKQALDAIEAMLNSINCRSLQTIPFDQNVEAMFALCAAIKQAQEPRQWQGLTGEEVAELTLEHVGYPVRLTEAIEAKLKEKNR